MGLVPVYSPKLNSVVWDQQLHVWPSRDAFIVCTGESRWLSCATGFLYSAWAEPQYLKADISRPPSIPPSHFNSPLHSLKVGLPCAHICHKEFDFRATTFCTYSPFLRLDRCLMPMGMEDKRILPGQLQASSSYKYKFGPDRARLNQYARTGRTGAWVAKNRRVGEWLQIDLDQRCLVNGIATQGRRGAHQWVKTYTMAYSNLGMKFKAYVSYGKVKVTSAC